MGYDYDSSNLIKICIIGGSKELIQKLFPDSIKDDTIRLEIPSSSYEELQLKAAMSLGALLIDGKAKKIEIGNEELQDAILQAARVKFTKTEYISCPGCGRTLYDLPATIQRVKAAFEQAAKEDPAMAARLASLKIGIMGCIVNGPGEMADADYGYVGAARGKVSLYRGKECVEKNIPEEEATAHLLELISSSLTPTARGGGPQIL